LLVEVALYSIEIVDGAVGAKFLGEVKKLIENPALMLV
jgi:pyruvate/2-oxoglutarate dehydrogenase complex dihydrolipoamide acyltransferase (E2) component